MKSATGTATYTIPADVTPRKPKAYVISIGVNAYQADAWTLQYAVDDASAMQSALAHLQGYEVVPISLISNGADPTRWLATKANIRGVLARLAGQLAPAGALADLAGAERLAQATPDDLIVITFSGHGYTAADHTFYLLPSDSGTDTRSDADADFSPDQLKRFVSSEELSAWLRPVDAGQMVMIIDACHSAASVDRPGFKPGPMGDRGLGQLAYDKAMRILAASQSDEVAMESEHLKQGLLTYALVHDGLVPGPDGKRAATDASGAVTLDGWLRYGEARTPTLYDDIRAGRRGPVYVGRDVAPDPQFTDRVTKRAQIPALFDYAKPGTASVVVIQ